MYCVELKNLAILLIVSVVMNLVTARDCLTRGTQGRGIFWEIMNFQGNLFDLEANSSLTRSVGFCMNINNAWDFYLNINLFSEFSKSLWCCYNVHHHYIFIRVLPLDWGRGHSVSYSRVWQSLVTANTNVLVNMDLLVVIAMNW